MAMKLGLGAAGSNGFSLAAGAVGAVVLVAGGYMVFQAVNNPADAPVVQPIAQVPQTPSDGPTIAAPVREDVAEDSDAANMALAAAPQFDLIRVDSDGATIIAGLADPGADVHIELDGKNVAVVQADATGNFVALLDVTLTDRPQVVTLTSVGTNGDRLVSDTSAIIDAVAAPPVPEPTTKPQDVAVPAAGADSATEAMAETPPARPEMPVSADGQEVPEAPVADPVVVAEVQPTSEPAPTPAPFANVSDAADASGEDAQADIVESAEATPQPSVSSGSAPQGDAPEPLEMAASPDAPIAPAPEVQEDLNSVAMEGVAAKAEAAPNVAAADTSRPQTLPTPPRILLASREGITIVQPGGQGPAVLDQVTLDSISYDAGGEVQLSGRGTSSANVQVYLNNRPVLTTRIAEDGQWRTDLPDVESGVYTLRIDEVRDDGTVASRLETPFQREDAAQLAAVADSVAAVAAEASADPQNRDAPQAVAPIARAVTVQPGSTLWAIARERFGSGLLYVRVFEANRDQIRDPDLIYPGQVFVVPVE